jgi:hypothetical protein
MVFVLPGEPGLAEVAGDFKIQFHDRQGGGGRGVYWGGPCVINFFFSANSAGELNFISLRKTCVIN